MCRVIRDRQCPFCATGDKLVGSECVEDPGSAHEGRVQSEFQCAEGVTEWEL